jgi:hypothetical protein
LQRSVKIEKEPLGKTVATPLPLRSRAAHSSIVAFYGTVLREAEPPYSTLFGDRNDTPGLENGYL